MRTYGPPLPGNSRQTVLSGWTRDSPVHVPTGRAGAAYPARDLTAMTQVASRDRRSVTVWRRFTPARCVSASSGPDLPGLRKPPRAAAGVDLGSVQRRAIMRAARRQTLGCNACGTRLSYLTLACFLADGFCGSSLDRRGTGMNRGRSSLSDGAAPSATARRDRARPACSNWPSTGPASPMVPRHSAPAGRP